MRSIHSNAGSILSKREIIAQVISNSPDKILFNEKQMDLLYDLALKWRINAITKEEFLTELRGGAIEDWVGEFGLALAIIIVLNNLDYGAGFQVLRPPHRQWLNDLSGNQRPGNDFGYGKGAGPRSITVIGMTQNAGSDKKEPSSGSYNYLDVMNQLNKQSNKSKVNIQVGDQIYTLKNPYRKDVYALEDMLADKIYDSIIESDTDICDIAQNLGFKATYIKKVKDHVFYKVHKLDNSGYLEAHNRAQSIYDGQPWKEIF